MEIEVTSWSHFLDLGFRDAWRDDIARHRSPYFFRGMSDSSFRLVTSLMRVGSHFPTVEEKIVKAFEKYANLDYGPRHDWKNVVLAQHYGLPTRLLDWTASPLVALHFCTADPSHSGRDGAVWCVNYEQTLPYLPHLLREFLQRFGRRMPSVEMLTRLEVEPLHLPSGDEDYVLFFEPPALDVRVINQAAILSVTSDPTFTVDDWLARHPDVSWMKLVVPAPLKDEFRDRLDQMNITERMLFPGLDGLSQYLLRHYSAPRTQSESGAALPAAPPAPPPHGVLA
jgi:hypothetical protein